MALDDKLRQLDEKVTGAVRRAVEEVQQQVAQQLDQLGSELSELKGRHSIQSNLPATFFDSQDLESELRQVAGDSGAEHRRNALDGLRNDIAAIDRCASQAEILDTLLERGSRYAPRTAVFLIRDGHASGWGARGFDIDADAVRELRFEATDGSPLARLADADACLDLNAAECASLCSHLEGAIPERGVLIPLILRDHLAAALYADQPKDPETEMETAALQTVTHVSCLALESLAFRARSYTSTLIGLDSEPSGEGDATPPASEIDVEGKDEVEVEVEVDRSGEATDDERFVAEEAESAQQAETAADEPEAEDTTEAEAQAEKSSAQDDEPRPAAATVAPPAEASGFATTFVSTIDPSDISATAEVQTEEQADEEEEVLESTEEVDIDIEVEDSEKSGFSQTAEIKADELVEMDLSTPATDETADPEVSPSGIGGYDEFDDASVEDAPDLEAPSDSPGVPWTAGGETAAAAASELPKNADPDATLLLNRPRPMTAPEAAPPVAPVSAPQPKPETPKPAGTGGGGGQVQPPEDLDGPGWAFSPTTEEASEGQGAVHDEARRLARLLVTEIELYNQEEVEQGRRSNDIYERLKEDIDRSRQMYDERIDPSVRDAKDYFYEELVRVLAAGDPRALGI